MSWTFCTPLLLHYIRQQVTQTVIVKVFSRTNSKLVSILNNAWHCKRYLCVTFLCFVELSRSSTQLGYSLPSPDTQLGYSVLPSGRERLFIIGPDFGGDLYAAMLEYDPVQEKCFLFTKTKIRTAREFQMWFFLCSIPNCYSLRSIIIHQRGLVQG